MALRRPLLITAVLLLAGAVAAGAGLAAGIALQGPGRFLSSPVGQWLQTHAPAVTSPLQPDLPAGMSVVQIGHAIPDLRLQELASGEPRALRAAGRRQLVNFWASWCGPCRDELPLLQAYAGEQGGNGVQVVFIALEDRDSALMVLPQAPAGALSLQDDPGPADSSVILGNTGGFLPYSVLIDEDGRLQRRHIGPFPDRASIQAFVTK